MIASAIKDYEASYDRYPASKPVETYSSDNGNPAKPDFTFGGRSPVTLEQRVRDNRDVMEILLATDYNDQFRANYQHRRNPKKTVFLNAKPALSSTTPGVDSEGVFRDGWGNPYVITIDMDDNGRCKDAVYSKLPDASKVGVNASGEVPLPVIVWSYGPDGQYDESVPADKGVNRDNILSWTVK